MRTFVAFLTCRASTRRSLQPDAARTHPALPEALQSELPCSRDQERTLHACSRRVKIYKYGPEGDTRRSCPCLLSSPAAAPSTLTIASPTSSPPHILRLKLDGRSRSRMAPKRKTHFSNVEIEQMLAEVRRSSPWTASLVVQPLPPFAKAAVVVVPG